MFDARWILKRPERDIYWSAGLTASSVTAIKHLTFHTEIDFDPSTH